MKITVTESAIVRPFQDTPYQRLWLSNLDILHPRYYLPTVYLYKPRSDHSSNFFEAKLLEEALSKVLVPFYPVAGRLARDENGRIEINCNGGGVLFVEAETDSTTSELGDFVPGLELGQLIPTIDDHNSGDDNIYHNSADVDRNISADISSHPLLLLQVTKFKCGGVCLGVGWHHTLADGAGFLHFINSWSSIARGDLSISDIRTFLDRTILRGRQVPIKSRFQHIEYEPPPTMKTSTKNPKSQSIGNFKITLDQLNALKAKVNNHNTKTTKYTTYEILTAHIWRCTCKARGLFREEDDQATKLRIAVDGRSRLNPPLPPSYFANVIFTAAPIAMSGDLLSESLTDTVERIHKAINRMDDEYLRSALDYLEETGDVSTEIVRGPQTCACPNLTVVSWMSLPFYKVDFGWGPPLLMRPGKMFEGKGYIYRSSADDGNFSLAICLETDHMQSFANLFYGRWSRL